MVPQQHGAFQILLCLLLVQILQEDERGPKDVTSDIRLLFQTFVITVHIFHQQPRVSAAHVVLLYLSQQVLLQVMTSKQHLSLVLAALQLVVLPLPPEETGLLLRLHLLQTLLLPDQPLLLLPLWGRLVLVQFLFKRTEPKIKRQSTSGLDYTRPNEQFKR